MILEFKLGFRFLWSLLKNISLTTVKDTIGLGSYVSEVKDHVFYVSNYDINEVQVG